MECFRYHDVFLMLPPASLPQEAARQTTSFGVVDRDADEGDGDEGLLSRPPGDGISPRQRIALAAHWAAGSRVVLPARSTKIVCVG